MQIHPNVTAKELLHIVNKGNDLGEIEFQSLVQLHREFPYFVLPTILAAKYQYNRASKTEEEYLPLAATQSPDRKRLKFLIENPIVFLPFLPNQQSPEVKISDELSESKSDAEILKPQSDATSVTAEEKRSDDDLPKKSSNDRSTKDVLKELEDNLTRLKSTGQEDATDFQAQEEHSNPEESKPSAELSPEALLAAIKQRKEKDFSDEKKQIQDEMIDEFNKKTIKFTTPQNSGDSDESPDLSIESTRLKENLISESFAKILVKQKKITEAKEIYQKLLLKFPDKKAYFANCLKQLEDN